MLIFKGKFYEFCINKYVIYFFWTGNCISDDL